MPGMFDRTRPDAEAVRRVKAFVAARVGLPETVTLAVAELRCHEPNCPRSKRSLQRVRQMGRQWTGA